MPRSDFPFPRAPAPPVATQQANAEHSVQLGLIKAAIDALRQGAPESSELVEQLCDYSHMHFMSEALLMRQSARPEYSAHLEQHERMLGDLDEIRSLAKGGKPVEAESKLRAHEKDVLDHICSWDRSM